jgi:hypothetical protein
MMMLARAHCIPRDRSAKVFLPKANQLRVERLPIVLDLTFQFRLWAKQKNRLNR